MAISYAHAQQHIGRPVCATLHDGRRHYGVLHRVTSDGIYLQPMQGRTVSGDGQLDATTADRPNGVEGEEAFFPFLFLPFLALAALTPWWGYRRWGYGYGYGYPGYFW